MNRPTSLIGRLQASGVLQPVDAALGQLIGRSVGDNAELVGVVAALTSAALAQGHSCLPLGELHAFAHAQCSDNVLQGKGSDSAELPLIPTADAIRVALRPSQWVACDGAKPAALVLDASDKIYLRRYFNYEQIVAATISNRMSDASAGRDGSSNGAATIGDPTSATDVDAYLRSAFARHFDADDHSDVDQRIAVLLAIRARFLIITGGPGAGKTSTVLRVLAILIEQSRAMGATPPRVALAAPTGKAAARMSQTLRVPNLILDEATRDAMPASATTLHRLLGISPGRAKPRHDRAHPLPYDLIIVDEASMLDLALAARLCDALGAETRLLLLGDRDQLASVEAGSVFGALCSAASTSTAFSSATTQLLENILSYKVENTASTHASPSLVDALKPAGLEASLSNAANRGSQQVVPMAVATANGRADMLVELRGSHRFGVHSAIGQFARAVRCGDVKVAMRSLESDAADLVANVVVQRDIAARIVKDVIPHFVRLSERASPEVALDQLDNFRVLCALREGPFGAYAVNAVIERELRRRASAIDAQGWFAGRLVMIATNDYTQGLFNGDVGVALASGTNGAMEIWLRRADGTTRALPPALLPKYDSAFALTVHKAQGSEFDEVLIVLPPRDARVLTRELLYTAVTRARKKVDLWTSKELLAATIARSTERWSGLADKL